MPEPLIVDQLIAHRLKCQNEREFFRRRRRINAAIILSGLLALLVLTSVYFYTDLLFGPVKSLNSDSGQGEWVVFAHDSSHSNNAGSPSFPFGRIKSVLSTKADFVSSPVVNNKIIYATGTYSTMYALAEQTGKSIWAFEAGGWIQSAPTIHAETLYFGANDGRMYALDVKTGEPKWTFKAPYAIKSSPAIAGGLVVFGAADNCIYAIREKDGKKVWQTSVENWIVASPVIINGIVCVGSWDGYLYTFNARDGRVRLKLNMRTAITTSPAARNSLFYSVAGHWLYAVNSSSRNWPGEIALTPYWQTIYLYGLAPEPPGTSGLNWSLFFQDRITGYPVLTDTDIIISNGDKLTAVDINEHASRWTFQKQGTLLTPPAIADRTAYTSSADGYIYALDASTGDIKWSLYIGENITASPVIADGNLYIGTSSGNLYIIE